MGTKLYTLPAIAQRLRVPPLWIESAFHELNVEPALVLNDTPYFDVADEGRAFDLLRDREAERIKQLKRPT